MEGVGTPIVAGLLSALVSAGLVSLFFRVSVRKAVWDLKRRHAGTVEGRARTKTASWVKSELSKLFSDLEVELTREQAQSARRRDLLAGVAHDLRGPLTSVRGFAETLLEKHREIPDPLKDEYLATILSNAELLSAMLDDFLELIRIDVGVATPRFAEVSLDQILTRITSRYKARAGEKRVTLMYEHGPEEAYLEADEVMLERVFSNLVDNAIKYTGPGGNVSIRLLKLANSVEVEISDTGMGISASEIPLVFERFYRVDKERSKSESTGLGLGLAIAKEIVDLHRGRIDVRSVPGEGTTFTVAIPHGRREKESMLA